MRCVAPGQHRGKIAAPRTITVTSDAPWTGIKEYRVLISSAYFVHGYRIVLGMDSRVASLVLLSLSFVLLCYIVSHPQWLSELIIAACPADVVTPACPSARVADMDRPCCEVIGSGYNNDAPWGPGSKSGSLYAGSL